MIRMARFSLFQWQQSVRRSVIVQCDKRYCLFHVEHLGAEMDEFSGALVILGLAAFFAGYVDSVVGGGGLIQIPALFHAFPNAAPAVLFATNKLASIVGTTSAAVQYSRRVRVPWRLVLPGIVAALIGSVSGAKALTMAPADFLRPLVLVLLIFVAIYTFIRKDFGGGSRTTAFTRRDVAIVVAIGAAVGFYDGFFGPGTGSFFIFLLIRFVRVDFLNASVMAKLLNVSTNISAISFFVFNVEMLWMVGAVMAVCNLTGALLGSSMALKHGVGFVRKMFLGVVSLLILKLAYDML
jgi:uncharacterized membrane protein YfcA